MGKSTLHVLFVAASGTKKLGPIPATYSGNSTCWDGCAMKGTACYAESNIRTSEPWARATAGAAGTLAWPEFLVKVRAIERGRLFRHNVAGDLPGVDGSIDKRMLDGLVTAARGKRGFTYTHKPVFGARYAGNREAIRKANAEGFTINLSGNNLAHADRLAALNIAPVVTVVTSDAPDKILTPAGRVVQVCPQQTGRVPNCAACGACAAANRRAIIGFRAHGNNEARADAIARGE